jgi:uncharacterized protein YndB with AHSA1/START domain
MSSTQTLDAIVKEITIKASAERVFRAFTDPEERMKWWGRVGGYRGTENVSDLRVGGRWESRGRSADGSTYAVRGTYLEVDPPRLLVFTWLHDWEEHADETVVRIELQERGGETVVRLTHSGFTSEKSRADHDEGWDRVNDWWRLYAENGIGIDEREAGR